MKHVPLDFVPAVGNGFATRELAAGFHIHVSMMTFVRSAGLAADAADANDLKDSEDAAGVVNAGRKNNEAIALPLKARSILRDEMTLNTETRFPMENKRGEE